MNWLLQNPAIIVQAALTLLGSAVAIWIAVFQQRNASRRERFSLEYKAHSSAPLVAVSLIGFSLDVAARLVILRSFDDSAEEKTQFLARTDLITPDNMNLDFDKSHFLGPKISMALSQIILDVDSYNVATTVESRLNLIDKIGLSLRVLDKALSSYYQGR